MIAIIDYGAGNIFSVKNALDYLDIDNTLTADEQTIRNAEEIILPGVGAFPSAMKQLEASGLVPVIKEQAKIKPFLGICLGMQLIFDKGFEFEKTDGLGLISGEVRKIERDTLSVPHMGWNSLAFNENCPLLNGIDENTYVYFVHSYAAVCGEKDVAAYCDYGGKVTALVYDGRFVYGSQFHPEKSGAAGMKMLRNFAALV